ncbi:hypothetical protein ACGFIF_00900 [Kribbella sp. NPDC049174]|uniref:hypothetical protein n=1 Tax=Kribbella sp. NPDC049174 TaxID=3364112 RepID=UPI00371D588F
MRSLRRSLVVLVGTAGLVVSLGACGSAEEPAGPQGQPAAPAGAGQQEGSAGQGQEGSPGQGQAGSPGQELAGIGSTLDAIDSELASDGSP